MKYRNTINNTIIIVIVFFLGISISRADISENMVLIPAENGIGEFYIDKYEITNAEYKDFIDVNPLWQKENALKSIVGDTYLWGWHGNMYPKGRANHPVVNISWFAAKAYAEWVGKELPTQAQWELAASVTAENKKYAWGDTDPKNKANYDRYTPKVSFRKPPTQVVGSYLPNEYGIYDMTGNIAEWCLDRLDVDDIHGRYHILRGGSWFDTAEELVISRISQHPSNDGMATVGFRCVLIKDGTQTTDVLSDMTSWLSENMQNCYYNECNSLSEGRINRRIYQANMDRIIEYFTGYSPEFEKVLIGEFHKVFKEYAPNIEPEYYSNSTEIKFLMWKSYLKILIEHNEKRLKDKLSLYRESLLIILDDILIDEGGC